MPGTVEKRESTTKLWVFFDFSLLWAVFETFSLMKKGDRLLIAIVSSNCV